VSCFSKKRQHFSRIKKCVLFFEKRQHFFPCAKGLHLDTSWIFSNSTAENWPRAVAENPGRV
jgi:hypothetical protein